MLAPPEFVDPVFFYFAEDVLALVRTDYWSLDAAECAALLEAHGSRSTGSGWSGTTG